jgi:membrane dipeptidase
MSERFAIDLMTGLKEVFDASAKNEHVRLGWWNDASAVAAISVTVGAFGAQEFSYSNAIRDLSVWQAAFDRKGTQLSKIRTSSDLDRLSECNRLGVLLNLQNATALEGPVEHTLNLFNLGIRQVQLTYNYRNLVGDGCLERANAGLSKYGRELIATLNSLGIAIDVSHCGHRTTLEAAEASNRPVMASHTGAWRLYSHPRNKTDEELRAIAETGGLIGIYTVPFFLGESPVKLDTVVDHVAYVAGKVGIEHVAIGTDRPDYDSNEASREVWEEFWKAQTFSAARDDAIRAQWPPFIEGARYLGEWGGILDRMVHRGFDAAAVRAVAGGNARRFFKQVLPPGQAAPDEARRECVEGLLQAGFAAGRQSAETGF